MLSFFTNFHSFLWYRMYLWLCPCSIWWAIYNYILMLIMLLSSGIALRRRILCSWPVGVGCYPDGPLFSYYMHYYPITFYFLLFHYFQTLSLLAFILLYLNCFLLFWIFMHDLIFQLLLFPYVNCFPTCQVVMYRKFSAWNGFNFFF